MPLIVVFILALASLHCLHCVIMNVEDLFHPHQGVWASVWIVLQEESNNITRSHSTIYNQRRLMHLVQQESNFNLIYLWLQGHQ